MEIFYRVSPTPKYLSIQSNDFGANIIHGFGVMLCGQIFRNDDDEDMWMWMSMMIIHVVSLLYPKLL